ncbi:LysR family transcriptional regulator [uncultured Massilia sp.]|uniref:LysR family transcriptional regulator n=1 Tax=uncultured Massilia sp. TaxID=169973 RepID=UPI0025E4DF1F|nr:LysR family transcriptional regulator [uncultured Massilia sp.]
MQNPDQHLLAGMGVLSAIVDSGSFGAAAEVLGMSQSGVSRAVARLETRVGVRLLDRTTRSVTLTDDGRRLLDQVMPLLAALEEAMSTALGGAARVHGRLRVNADPFFCQRVLAPHLGDFLARYPELQVEIVSRDQLGDMVADGFDLAIRFGVPRPSSLVARKLLETRILTVAAPAYLARYGRPAKPEELANTAHTCIRYRDPETGRPFEWEFKRRRRTVKVDVAGRLTVNDVATMHGICLAGEAIAQVMTLGVEPYMADGRLVELFADWPDDVFPVYAYYPSRHHMPARVRAFLDFVIAMTEKLAAL